MNQNSDSNAPKDTVKIFTIGHSNVPASEIVNLLKKFEIDILFDVRSSPYSKYAHQFNKDFFNKILEDNGIEYHFAGTTLGGRPTDPSCYKNESIPDGSADYLHLVDYPIVMTKDFFLSGIEEVFNMSTKGRVALMCSEEDPAKCHRHHLIGRYLVKQGVTVLHIRGDGNIVKDQHLPNLSNAPPAEQLDLF